jgi:LPS export ABC transporter protein LptC
LGINTVLYDISGQINYRLRAERQTQFTDETTLLEKPTIRLYQQGMPSWNVVADTGTIPQPETSETGDTRLILLNGNVRVHSENRFGNQTTTDSLDVNIDKEQLSTLALVFVETEVISQTSTGMFADLGKDEIIFHQNTQGTYAHDKSN